MATHHEQQMKILEEKIGALAVQINRCQAMVFAIFHAALNTDIGRSESHILLPAQQRHAA